MVKTAYERTKTWRLLAEKVVDRAKIRQRLLDYFEGHAGHFTGKTHKESTKSLIGKANKTAQLGCRNSQFGRPWVNDGINDKKIDAAELPFMLESGWKRGRAKNKKFSRR